MLIIYQKKITFEIVPHENGEYLASIIDDSVITCNEIIEKTKTFPTTFNEKNLTCETNSIFFLPSLLITVALLIAVSICCDLIKCRAKEKH